ncbi:zinc finger protein JAGGED-like protein [Tanacetum coccineum]|uniref:Zinc finger protein JAGGED-like protein n=1 Tax=Tanacetum coccineum TaxID=301880 RepID=A0ABQ4YXZ2_9ASTR
MRGVLVALAALGKFPPVVLGNAGSLRTVSGGAVVQPGVFPTTEWSGGSCPTLGGVGRRRGRQGQPVVSVVWLLSTPGSLGWFGGPGAWVASLVRSCCTRCQSCPAGPGMVLVSDWPAVGSSGSGVFAGSGSVLPRASFSPLGLGSGILVSGLAGYGSVVYQSLVRPGRLDDQCTGIPWCARNVKKVHEDVERAFGVLHGKLGDSIQTNRLPCIRRSTQLRQNRRNPLDLNNFPDDFTKDQSKQPLDDSSSSASGIYRKKKNGAKDESGKVYECRFCSLKFCKSQALGGHMNRHRQERETETLNRARQLVFSNDNLIPQLPHQLGGQPVLHGGFHHQASCNIGSTLYPARPFSETSTTILPPVPPQPAQHMYTSPGSRLNNHYLSQYPLTYPTNTINPMNDYFVGHICSTGNPPPDSTNNYTCIGAPVVQSFTFGGGSGASGRNMSTSTVNRYHE